MQARRIGEGVYVCDDPVMKVARESVAELKQLAWETSRQRAGNW